jgi:ferrous iron transport protein A
VLRELFTEILSLPAKDAEEAACSMEHGMNKTVCRAIKSLVSGYRKNKTLAQTIKQTIDNEINALDCASACHSTPDIKEDTEMTRNRKTLNILKSGEQGTIEKISGTGALKKRLIELGVTTGQQIYMVKSAPLDDPIEVKIRNFNLSLRREEAEHIILKN